jgi:hypothetical protein
MQALAKYDFGLGLTQMFLCTLAFSLFSLPVGKGIGTQILEVVSWQCLASPSSTQQTLSMQSYSSDTVHVAGLPLASPLAAQVFRASPQLAAIRSVDEAVVIGVALSLSSSAFVLQLLNERGEMATKFGSATLGILLMQVRPCGPHTSPAFPHRFARGMHASGDIVRISGRPGVFIAAF